MIIEEKIGVEILAENSSLAKNWGRCGLLCNHSSVTKTFKPSVSILKEILGKQLLYIMAPQHGYWSTEQDNMIETPHSFYLNQNLKIYSLYEKTRIPSEEMLDKIETLIIDLPIVGCRVYTYKWTLFNCLIAAKEHNKKIIVLDRLNPLGGEQIEGACLEPELSSFVGMHPLPMRHGLSVGELARIFNIHHGADLTVIKMENWNVSKPWPAHRPWVPTSPNLPTLDAVAIYPGMVLFEGTNLSEGRGTTSPFQLIGAPYIKDSSRLIKRVHELYPKLAGVFLQEVSFRPVFGKWASQVCNGVAIRILNRKKINSYLFGLSLLKACIDIGEEKFAWKEPPYEYNYKTLPIKLILGKELAANHLTNNTFSCEDSVWSAGISGYIETVSSSLLYPRVLKGY